MKAFGVKTEGRGILKFSLNRGRKEHRKASLKTPFIEFESKDFAADNNM